jgi:O-antigen/teichoic acid export membrane protein
MSSKESVVQNILSYSVANIFLKAANFLLLPIISHFIMPREYGYYSLFLTGYLILLTVIQGGLYSTLTKFFLDADNEKLRQKTFSILLSGAFIIGLGMSALIYLTAPQMSIAITGTTSYISTIRLFAWLLVLEACVDLILQLQKTKEEVGKVIFYTFVNAGTNFILTFIFIIYYKYGIYGLVLAQVIAHFTTMLLMSAYTGKNFTTQNLQIDLTAIVKFSLPLMLAGIFTTCTDLADRIILDHFYDSQKVGIYSFSYKIANVMYIYVIAFRTAWVPHAIKKYGHEGYSEHFGRVFTKYLFMALSIFLSVSLLVPVLFDIKLSDSIFLFNPAYRSGITILPFILLGYLCNGIVSFNSIFPYTTGKSTYFLFNDGISFVLNISLNFVLIPIWGMNGAALATFVSYIVPAFYMYSISRNVIKVTYQKVSVAVFAGAALFIYAVGVYLNNVFIDAILLLVFLLIGQRTMKLSISDLFMPVKTK